MHRSAVGLGSLSVGLSSGALATALTGFGIVASPALAGVATVCGLTSVGFAAPSKQLNRKVTKHEKIYTRAVAKQNSINELISKALEDKSISDAEFQIISREVKKYHELKAEIRAITMNSIIVVGITRWLNAEEATDATTSDITLTNI